MDNIKWELRLIFKIFLFVTINFLLISCRGYGVHVNDACTRFFFGCILLQREHSPTSPGQVPPYAVTWIAESISRSSVPRSFYIICSQVNLGKSLGHFVGGTPLKTSCRTSESSGVRTIWPKRPGLLWRIAIQIRN